MDDGRLQGPRSEAGLTSRIVGSLIWVVSVALAAPTAVLLVLGASESTPADSFGLAGFGGLAFLVAAIAFATTGRLLTTRTPGNAIGRIFSLGGVLVVVGNLAYQYADYALFISSSSLPGGVFAAWLQNLTLPPAFGLLGMSLLLFPDGRLLSQRWRPALWLALTGISSVVLGYALRPGPLDTPFETVTNPIGIPGTYDAMGLAASLGWPLMAASLALAAFSVLVRRRRSNSVERQQIKWIALGAAVVGVVFAANVASFLLPVEGIDRLRLVAVGLVLATFPVTTGVAILRYRLYDIDVVINRALVYGTLTAVLAAAYLGSVLLLQLIVSPRSDVAVAGSTLAVAAIMRPARLRIQELVDRRFFRSRYDTARTLDSFGVQLRNAVAIDSLAFQLRSIVAETTQPVHVSLWLRGELGTNPEDADSRL